MLSNIPIKIGELAYPTGYKKGKVHRIYIQEKWTNLF